jgi:hypothetical protein
MPIPKPKKDEKQTAFISRCMGNPTMVKEYKDSKQRSAICYSQWRGKSNMHINSTIANVQSRSEQFMGRDHVVVPVIMVVEGVHAGSAGPMFYPSEEIKATAEQWDGVPVTVQHPRDKDGDLTIAANAPEYIIGHISGSIWDDKLRAEAWIDIEKTNAISTDIMTIIRADGQLQVSTGLFSEDEIIKGDWKGESYNAVVRNITPDHLALLPGEKGACSWEDGCGIRANKEGGEKMKFKGFDMGGEDILGIPKPILQAFFDNQLGEATKWEGKFKTNEMSHSDIRSQIQNEINDKDTQIQWNFVRDVFDKFFVYSKEQDGQPVQMFKQGYSLNASEAVEFTGDEVEVVQKTEYILKSNKKFNRKENKMANEKEKCCSEKVKALIANEKSNYTEEDTEWLEDMEEVQLDKMIANVGISEDAEKSLVTAAVEKAFDDAVNSGEVVRVEKKDPDKKETPPTAEEYIANAPAEIQEVLGSSLHMLKEKKAALVQQIVANEQNRFTQEQLDAKEVAELENIAALIPLKVVDEGGQQVSYAANSGNINNNTGKEEPLEMPAMEIKK